MNNEPNVYRMTVHIFGATSSPGCANFALKRLAQDYKSNYSNNTIEFLQHGFYVDDAKSVSEALLVVDESRKLCADGQLRLHKFMSNSRDLLDHIPESERAVSMSCIDLNFDELPTERVLGISWNAESDTLQFNVNIPSNTHPDRRTVLSIIASLYDPLGLIAPFVLRGKMILQSMCKEDVSWDEPLPAHLMPKWKTWLENLSLLNAFCAPRCFVKSEFGNCVRRELHHFSDASTVGYGQCTYIRQINECGDVSCSLVMGKARVTPMRMVTIPRLELTAALLSVKISKLLQTAFKYPIDEEYFWTDSTIVLCYLKNDTRRFHVYVANRIEQIKDHTNSSQWHHVQSKDNPADHASRSLDVNALAESNWNRGPEFLWCSTLPTAQPIDTDLSVDDPEVKAHVMQTSIEESDSKDFTMLNRFSSWQCALKAVSLCLRFKNIMLEKIRHQAQAIENKEVMDTVAELDYAKNCIVKYVQRQVYDSEILILKNNGILAVSNKLAPLDPFLDIDGLLRVGGRLKNSSYLYGVKHPLIIPKDTHVTRLLIAYHHEQTYHQGRGLTMNQIRSSGLWIIGSSKAVSSYIFRCVTCRRTRKKEEQQKMADLPSDRLEPSPPFTHCGVDCFGPFLVKDGRKCMKKYGLIVTCLSSRAIHIECLDDMTTDVFINALRCVIAIRGPIRTIRCDQGSNFKGASHELKQAMKENMNTDTIRNHLCTQNCEFIFNSPHSSHMGGIWERNIRTVRSVLDVILYQHPSRLDSASLRTFLYEVMAIVNSRPLTLQNMSDSDAPLPLSPNHLLTFKSNVVVPPPGHFDQDDVYSRKRWRKVQGFANEFWQRWKKEYVLMLQNRPKWQKSQRNVQINDIMLLKDDDVPRNQWKLGRVTEILPTRDGHTRRVKMIIGDSYLSKDGKRSKDLQILERPIHKLVLILENDAHTT